MSLPMAHQITTTAKKTLADGTVVTLDFHPFQWGGEHVAGFLANIRNLNGERTLSEPYGWPVPWHGNRPDTDLTGEAGEPDAFATKASVSVRELQTYVYDQEFEDRTKTAASTAERMTPLRKLLGARFFTDIQALEVLEAEVVEVSFTVV